MKQKKKLLRYNNIKKVNEIESRPISRNIFTSKGIVKTSN
jgi:hypothetical protein